MNRSTSRGSVFRSPTTSGWPLRSRTKILLGVFWSRIMIRSCVVASIPCPRSKERPTCDKTGTAHKIKQKFNISQSLEMRSVIRLLAECLRYLNGTYVHVLAADKHFNRFLKPEVVSNVVVGVLQKNGSGLAVVS